MKFFKKVGVVLLLSMFLCSNVYANGIKFKTRYDEVRDFSNGLAVVYKEGRYGVIDEEGNEVVGLGYNYISDFSDGVAIVINENKYGVIDKTGKEIIPVIYDAIYKSEDRLICIIGCEGNSKSVLMDLQGNRVTNVEYNFIDVFVDGLARVGIDKDGVERMGVIDKNGNVVIDFKYYYIGEIGKDLIGYIESREGLMGVMDKTGKVVIKPKYDYIGKFVDGLAIVANTEGKYGVIDKTGREVIPCKYKSINDFSSGVAFVYKDKFYMGIIDKLGNEIELKDMYYSVYDKCKYGLFVVNQSSQVDEVINIQEKKINTRDYSKIWTFNEGLAVVELKGKCGAIDYTGKEVVPIKYDLVSSFRDGYALVVNNKKSGLVDREGKEVIPVEYDNIAYIDVNKYLVVKGDEGKVVDLSSVANKKVSEIKLDVKKKVINAGDVFKLNVDIDKTASDKRVVWFSSNPKVVSVDDKGNVKGLNVGKALVVVQAIYGDVYDICEVEVKKQEEVVKEVPITSIKLNKTALDLRVGNKYKLVATIQPVNATNKNLVWVSSNPKVVSVDGKGNVVAKGKGKAIITVRNVKGDKKAICNVTVR